MFYPTNLDFDPKALILKIDLDMVQRYLYTKLKLGLIDSAFQKW